LAQSFDLRVSSPVVDEAELGADSNSGAYPQCGGNPDGEGHHHVECRQLHDKPLDPILAHR
jgi:hypothetical protein